MPLSWFDTRAIRKLADDLVQDMLQRIPPQSLQPGRGGAKQKARLRKIHDQALVSVAEFSREKRPGFLQKALLAHRVRWALQEAGYPKEFVDEFGYALAAVAASAHSQREI